MWLVRGGKQLGMAGRTPHGGLCLVHPTSTPPVSHWHHSPWVTAPPVGTTTGAQPWEPPMSPTAHPKRPVTAGLGRAAAGAAVPQGFATRTPASSEEPPLARMPPRQGWQMPRGVCTRGERPAGRQAAPVGVADMWDTGMPPSGCQEWDTGGCEAEGAPGCAENSGTRLVPGANPPHPTEHPAVTPPQTPPPSPARRRGWGN